MFDLIITSHGGEERRAEGNGDGEVTMSEPRAVVRTLACERKPYVEGFAHWRSIGRYHQYPSQSTQGHHN